MYSIYKLYKMSSLTDIVYTSIPSEDKFYDVLKSLYDNNDVGIKQVKKLNEYLLKEINSKPISDSLKKMKWTTPTVPHTDSNGEKIPDKKYTMKDYKEQLEKKTNEKGKDIIKYLARSLFVVFIHKKKSESVDSRKSIPISEYVLEHDPKFINMKIKNKNGNEKGLRSIDYDSIKSIYTDQRILDGIYRYMSPSLQALTRYIINRSDISRDIKEEARNKLTMLFTSDDNKMFKHDFLTMILKPLLSNIPKDYKKTVKKSKMKTVKKSKEKKSKESDEVKKVIKRRRRS